jgi:hypothetical protein
MRHVGPTSHIAHRIFIPSSNFNLSRCYDLVDIRYVRVSFAFSCRQTVQYEYRVATYSLTRYPIVHRQLPKASATSELVLERSSGTLRSFTQHHTTSRLVQGHAHMSRIGSRQISGIFLLLCARFQSSKLATALFPPAPRCRDIDTHGHPR